MPRATRVLRAAERRDTSAVDTLILPHAQRQAQKGFLFGVKGTCVEIDFAEPVRLRTDDALVLDDGGLVEIVAEPEPLIEARAAYTPGTQANQDIQNGGGGVDRTYHAINPGFNYMNGWSEIWKSVLERFKAANGLRLHEVR